MSIVENRKAFHDYFIEERFEAGLALEGWEVKAIRAGRAHLKEAYVVVKGGEIVLVGAHVTPLTQASTHVRADPTRTRKLLLHREEIDKIERRVNERGLTVVPLALYFVDGRAKIEIGLAKGKKSWDKRQALAARQADREKEQAVGRRLKGMDE